MIYFSIENWIVVIRYRHTMGIKKLFTDLDGTKIVFIDDHSQGYVYSPVIFVYNNNLCLKS